MDAHLAAAGRPLGLSGDPAALDPEVHQPARAAALEPAQRSPYQAYRVAHARRRRRVRLRARPAGLHAGLEPVRGLSGRRRVPRVPQDALARRAQALAGQRAERGPGRQAALRPGRGRSTARAGTPSILPSCWRDRADRGAEPRRRGRGAVRHRAVRALVVRGPRLPRRRLPRAARQRDEVRPATGSAAPGRSIRPARRSGCPGGSWGANGDCSMWLSDQTAWTWERLWPLEEAFWDVAPARARVAERARPILAQAARELLLAQSSDWQFIISTGAAADYAERRFREHCNDAEELIAALADGSASGARLGAPARRGAGPARSALPQRAAGGGRGARGLPLARRRLSAWRRSGSRSASISINPSATSITSSSSTWTTSTARCSSALADREFLPVVLHLSGPLLEWLEAHDTGLSRPARASWSRDRQGRAAAGRLLRAGARLAAPRRTGSSRSSWMHEAVRRRFGVDARGLWLTERVWEPELAADLADAGVRYALVDDRHFLVTGFASRAAPRAVLDRERRQAGGALPHRRAAPLPDSVPAAGGDRGLPARAPRRRPPAGGAGRRRREVRRLARHQGVGVRARDGWTGSWGRSAGWSSAARSMLSTAGRCARHGAERRARLPADRVVSRDGGLVASPRCRAAARPAGARSRRGPRGRARRAR